MEIFIKQMINGLQLGSIYGLIALGYTMVYGIAKLINFAHGDIIMVGAYFSLVMLSLLKLPLWVTFIGIVILCGIMGVLIERVAYKPLRKSSRMSALITAIGMSFFLENLFLLVFTSNPRPFENYFTKYFNILFGDTALHLGNIIVSYLSILTIFVTIIIMIGLSLFVKFTKIGTAMRAVSQDFQASQLMGININTTISVTFFIGSALAAVASLLFSTTYPSIQPYMGSMLGLKAFIAAVLGGIGVIPGAMLGGIIMGLTESMIKGYVSSQLSDAVVFSILIIVLLVKPSGILGRNVKEKV